MRRLTLGITFLLLSTIVFAQAKKFATKQEAEIFLIDNIKKAPFDYFKFDSYTKGEILFKNDEIEEMDEDDLKEPTGSDFAIATVKAKVYKCNKYVKVYLNKITNIRIDTIKASDGKTHFKCWAKGNKIMERGYMPKKTKDGYLKKYLNEFLFLDTKEIESTYDKREDLLMSGDKVLQADFLEAVKVYTGLGR